MKYNIHDKGIIKQMAGNKSSKALKAGVWYTFSNFLSKGLVFLTTSIFARVLTKTEYGEYSNFATWQSLLLIVVTFELYSTIARARYDYEAEIDQYVSTITILGSCITFVFYLFTIAFMPFVSDVLSIDPKYIHIMFMYILVAPALQTYQAKCRIFMEYRSATILTIASSVTSILFAVLLVLLLDDKLFGRIIGQQAVLIIFNIVIYIWIVYKGRSFNRKYFRYALGIAVPLVPHIIAGNLLGSFDKIAIQKLCGSEDLAYYSLAFNCALLANVLWSSLNQAMVPWLFDNLSNNNIQTIRRISKYYIGIFMAAAVGILLLVPEVVFIFGGRGYEEAKYVMAPIIMGSCFQFVYSMYVNIEMYEKKTILISIGTVGAALLNIPLNYFFIKLYGYTAAAYTTVFCYAALAVFHYLIVKGLKKNNTYDNRFNLLILTAMSLVTVVVNSLYSHNILRLTAIILYFAIVLCTCIKWRDKVRQIIMMVIRK